MIKIAGDNNNNDSAAWTEVCSYQRKVKKVGKRKLIIFEFVKSAQIYQMQKDPTLYCTHLGSQMETDCQMQSVAGESAPTT